MKIGLDAFALLAWLQNERGSDAVNDLLLRARQGEHQCFISVINLGEVYYRLSRLKGRDNADAFWDDIRNSVIPLSVVEASRSRVYQAAQLKASYPIAYADALAAQLVIEKDMPLVTGDPELQALEEDGLITIHWVGN